MRPRVEMSLLQKQQLIAEVRARPMLYDTQHPNYSSHTFKQKQWRKIAASLDMPPSSAVMLKAKWKLFRDTFARYLRTHQEEGQHNRYRWSEEMSFMLPHLRQRPAAAPAEPENRASSERDTSAPGVAASLAPGGDSAPLRELDATELMFLGLARTVRAFSPLRAVRARAAVTNLVLKLEAERLQTRAVSGEASGAASGAESGSASETVSGAWNEEKCVVKIEPGEEDYSVYFDT